MNWLVYLLRCADDTLYIGSTNDLEKRLADHNSGRGAKYTKGRAPCIVVKTIECDSKSEALKLEAQWKKVPRNKKADFEKEPKETELYLIEVRVKREYSSVRDVEASSLKEALEIAKECVEDFDAELRWSDYIWEPVDEEPTIISVKEAE